MDEWMTSLLSEWQEKRLAVNELIRVHSRMSCYRTLLAVLNESIWWMCLNWMSQWILWCPSAQQYSGSSVLFCYRQYIKHTFVICVEKFMALSWNLLARKYPHVSNFPLRDKIRIWKLPTSCSITVALPEHWTFVLLFSSAGYLAYRLSLMVVQMKNNS